MCGIAGFICRGPRPDAMARLEAMGSRIQHRGPDGDGFFVKQTADQGHTVGLVHRRLAIIDLATGDQPMSHAEAGVTLIFNGEIYNYKTLRAELEQRGHRFRTQSDTEVLLNAYVEWGPACVERFRGMFAFALWDHPRNRLVLARDHFGKKPLHIMETDGRLLFGSEIKAILAFGNLEVALDRASVSDYFVYRYVPGPHTLFSGIRKLPPGSYAVWQDGRLETTSYYTPPYGEEPLDLPPVADPLGEFERVLDESVQIRMVSDVPYGAFLSGGLDSSTIVAMMTRHSSQPINTFAVGFKEAVYSELPYARLAAEKFRTRHTELVISASDLMEHLPKLIDHSDAPVSEASNIPIYLISREAAKSVKMVLTGEGSDELLGGYPKHSAERFVPCYQRFVPQGLHRGIVEPVIHRLPYEARRLKIMMASFGIRDRHERMPRWLGALSFRERDNLLAADLPRRPVDLRPFQTSPRRSAIEQILYFDQTSWLPDNLLERGDRITMAASIEARMPFMDTALTALMARLPDEWRIRGFTQKYILRRLMKDRLPKTILDRPKVGFRVPVGEWFRGPMRSFMRDCVDSPNSIVRAICKTSEIRRILDEHESGRQNNERLLWTLMNFELFNRNFNLG